VSLYLDASVILPRVVEEPGSEAVRAYMLTTDEERLISDLAGAEVASGLSRMVRMRVMSPGDAEQHLGDFEIWRAATASPVDLHAADARLAYAYVRRFDLALRAPDALHLAIAHRLDATLVTLDRRMARAAAELGIAAEVPATP
jgi:predicted nucleic acid-binding protein